MAFEIETQGTSSRFSYSDIYGEAAPPPGFPDSSANTVIPVRKSFIVCADYAADTGGGTACRRSFLAIWAPVAKCVATGRRLRAPAW